MFAPQPGVLPDRARLAGHGRPRQGQLGGRLEPGPRQGRQHSQLPGEVTVMDRPERPQTDREVD